MTYKSGQRLAEATISDIERPHFLKIYVDLANSERQTIWARNAAMVVANSFILGVLSFRGSRGEWAFGIVGVTVCCLWLAMTFSGWGHFYRHLDKAAGLYQHFKPNPFPAPTNRFLRDTIFRCVFLLILLFIFVYILITARFLCGQQG